MAEEATPDKARDLLQQGLARYGCGEVEAALEAWREALALEPDNVEAQKLVQFVEERMASGVVDARRTTRTMPFQREKTELKWGPGPLIAGADDTDPSTRDTAEVAAIAGANLAAGADHDTLDDEGPMRRRRDTLVSSLSAILAPSTRSSEREHTNPTSSMPAVSSSTRRTPLPTTAYDPKAILLGSEPTAAPAPNEYEDISSAELNQLIDDDSGARDFEDTDKHLPINRSKTPPVPVGPASEEVTRPIGDDGGAVPSKTPVPPGYNRSETPVDIALAAARQRAAQLVDECRAELDGGNLAAAAIAADEAIEEGDKAPLPGIAEIIEPARALFEKAFAGHVGRDDRVPQMSAETAAINTGNFDHRTGFLLSCIDGTLPIQTLVDISGMARFDCLRTLSRLLNQGIIKFD